MTPIIIENLNEVEGWEPRGPGLPLGRHPAQIDGIEEGNAGTGSPRLRIEWLIIGGPHTGAGGPEFLTVLPQTYGKIKTFLQAVGYQIPEGQFQMPTTELLHCRAQIVVAQENYQDRTYNRVVGHLPIAGAAGDAAPAPPAPDGASLPFKWESASWSKETRHNPFVA